MHLIAKAGSNTPGPGRDAGYVLLCKRWCQISTVVMMMDGISTTWQNAVVKMMGMSLGVVETGGAWWRRAVQASPSVSSDRASGSTLITFQELTPAPYEQCQLGVWALR